MDRDELIEKMARVIWNKTIPGGYDPISREESWKGWKSIFLKHAAAVLEVIEDNGMVVVPREPTPEMIANALPITGIGCDPVAERIAERALFILEPPTIELKNHRKGREAALSMITDYRAMIQTYINKDKP